MNETKKLICFSFSCPFTCQSQAEMEEHEKQHEEENKAINKLMRNCEECDCVPCECNDKGNNCE